jgi:hypothetical protein
MRRALVALAGFTTIVGIGCSDSAGQGTAGASGSSPTSPGAELDSGAELRVEVPAYGRVYVRLGPPAVVTPTEAATSADWDLAFDGWDVFTNSSASGTGQAAAFGPLDAVTFLGDTAPQVPFLVPDKTGGAFLDWYAYEGSSHALYSRFHVYGIKDGPRLFKVQVLGYYGQRDGAAVSAIYGIRYAETTEGNAGPTHEIADLDGTAGGTAAPASAPSECVDLGTGARTMLTPSAALGSTAWHLCFRRSSISVNGESGGPRSVGAVDLGADLVASETVERTRSRSADSERSVFDQVTAASLSGKSLRGDRVVSSFGDRWLDRARSPIGPARAAWLAQSAAGAAKYLLAFASFVGPTTTSPGTVVLKIKPVKG